jgi:hypothetical protein
MLCVEDGQVLVHNDLQLLCCTAVAKALSQAADLQ